MTLATTANASERGAMIRNLRRPLCKLAESMMSVREQSLLAAWPALVTCDSLALLTGKPSHNPYRGLFIITILGEARPPPANPPAHIA